MAETTLSKLHEELVEIKLAMSSFIGKFEERCNHHIAALEQHKKSLGRAFDRLDDMEKIATGNTDHIQALLKAVQANTDVIKELTRNTTRLQTQVEFLEKAATDRENRMRDLEKYRWYLMGGIAILIFVSQYLFKYVI